MKRFRRTFLIISGILTVLGIILIIVGLLNGGIKSVTNDLLNNRLSISLGDVFYTDEEFDNMNSITDETNRFSKEDVKSFVLKGNAGEYEVTVWDESDYSVQGIKGNEHIRYSLEKGVLTVASHEQNLIRWGNSVKAKIFIPKDAFPEKIALNIGAGELICNSIKTNNLDVNIGTGEGIFNNVEAINAQFNVGAGDGEINNASFTECELRVGIGDIDLSGNIWGNTNINCGVGNMDLELINRYSDFNYAIKVGAGDVRVGREKYSGVSNVVNLDNGSDKLMNIKCGLGDVSVEFADASSND